jgi:uncharacterized membrane protein YgdD (TMEM256/DUF423 family)
MTNRTLQKSMFQASTGLIAVAVMLGAFGAHGFKNIATPEMVQAFQTGVQYQFIHAAGLLILSLNLRRVKEQTISSVYPLFVGGIVLFCGSLYLLAILPTLGFSENRIWVGALTPVGGICFIAGWALLAYKGYKPFDGNSKNADKTYSRSEPARNAA